MTGAVTLAVIAVLVSRRNTHVSSHGGVVTSSNEIDPALLSAAREWTEKYIADVIEQIRGHRKKIQEGSACKDGHLTCLVDGTRVPDRRNWWILQGTTWEAVRNTPVTPTEEEEREGSVNRDLVYSSVVHLEDVIHPKWGYDKCFDPDQWTLNAMRGNVPSKKNEHVFGKFGKDRNSFIEQAEPVIIGGRQGHSLHTYHPNSPVLFKGKALHGLKKGEPALLLRLRAYDRRTEQDVSATLRNLAIVPFTSLLSTESMDFATADGRDVDISVGGKRRPLCSPNEVCVVPGATWLKDVILRLEQVDEQKLLEEAKTSLCNTVAVCHKCPGARTDLDDNTLERKIESWWAELNNQGNPNKITLDVEVFKIECEKGMWSDLDSKAGCDPVLIFRRRKQQSAEAQGEEKFNIVAAHKLKAKDIEYIVRRLVMSDEVGDQYDSEGRRVSGAYGKEDEEEFWRSGMLDVDPSSMRTSLVGKGVSKKQIHKFVACDGSGSGSLDRDSFGEYIRPFAKAGYANMDGPHHYSNFAEKIALFDTTDVITSQQEAGATTRKNIRSGQGQTKGRKIRDRVAF